MIQLNPFDLLFGKEISVKEGVKIRIPVVEEVAYTQDFGKYTHLFTVTTRELFSSQREVDELEQRFPTVWRMMFGETDEGDFLLGKILGVETPGSVVVMEAIAYWTGLDVSGFRKLGNGKMIHVGADWIITEETFDEISEVIKVIIGFEPSTDFIAPKNMSDSRYKAWMNIYKGRVRANQRNKRTLADKILILSISMESFIPIEEIRKMPYFQFSKLYEGLSEKEAYRHRWDVKISPKFESDNKPTKHWKEAFKIQK